MDKFEKYHKAIDFLEGLFNLPLENNYVVDKNHANVYIKRMRYFLNVIGNPDRKLKFIHITGTSGKGTVTNMIHEILFASGKKTGSFTSPSVVVSIEKIKMNDKYISPDEFADIVDYLKPFIDRVYKESPYGALSYFEIFFAIALVYFKKQECEWVVLEVGLGGRYDATNVIEKPIITAITNIDYDHTELLGKTLKEIALDKAGIIKRGSTFFTTEQRQSLLRIFDEICDKKRVILHRLPFQDNYEKYNKELATAIAKQLGINGEYITNGIKRSWLMCRFEIVDDKPIVILDGAHNRSKIKATVDNLKKIKYEKLYLIIGIADNKDHVSILKQIIPKADHIFFTRFQYKIRKCAHPNKLYAESKKYLKKEANTEIFLDAEKALFQALKEAKQNDLILVTGSFYIAGELRKCWLSEDVILKSRMAKSSKSRE
jgi:dihydrofolate synthase / folylpolyglutamate synthase